MNDESEKKNELEVQPDTSGGDDGDKKAKTAIGTGDDDGSGPLAIALNLARKHGHNYVGTSFLLFGLIKWQSGKASEILRELNLSEDEICNEVEEHIGYGTGFVAKEIPFAPRAKEVLVISWELARKRKHNYVGTEHMLLALMQDKDSYVFSLLEKYNIDVEKVEALI